MKFRLICYHIYNISIQGEFIKMNNEKIKNTETAQTDKPKKKWP